jgi:hypothetical protein
LGLGTFSLILRALMLLLPFLLGYHEATAWLRQFCVFPIMASPPESIAIHLSNPLPCNSG